jgi:hypothetical protein
MAVAENWVAFAIVKSCGLIYTLVSDAYILWDARVICRLVFLYGQFNELATHSILSPVHACLIKEIVLLQKVTDQRNSGKQFRVRLSCSGCKR